jgi:hypothetical protein
MSEQTFWGTISAVALAVVGVATVAVIVSRNANTTGVIQATGNAFSQSLLSALSPVTGTSSNFGGFPGTSTAWGGISAGGNFSFPIT